MVVSDFPPKIGRYLGGAFTLPSMVMSQMPGPSRLANSMRSAELATRRVVGHAYGQLWKGGMGGNLHY